MFHALLSGKLAEDVPAPDRFEDALTSSVFGTLVLLGASDVLSEWFRNARDAHGAVYGHSRPSKDLAYWFWPRLAGVEPDVIVRIGRHIYVVEAKYRSRLHDLRPTEEMINTQLETGQLCRQWARMADLRDGRASGPPDLCDAARQCDATFVLLVDQRGLAWAQGEVRKFHLKLPGADLRVLTWQDLHRILTIRIRRGWAQPWMVELTRYLAHVDLDGFTGMHLDDGASAGTRRLLGWARNQSETLDLAETARRLVFTYRHGVPIRRWGMSIAPKKSSPMRETVHN